MCEKCPQLEFDGGQTDEGEPWFIVVSRRDSMPLTPSFLLFLREPLDEPWNLAKPPRTVSISRLCAVVCVGPGILEKTEPSTTLGHLGQHIQRVSG